MGLPMSGYSPLDIKCPNCGGDNLKRFLYGRDLSENLVSFSLDSGTMMTYVCRDCGAPFNLSEVGKNYGRIK